MALELDYMEGYTTNALAQAAYVTNAPLLPTSEYAVGSNTLLSHFNGTDGQTTYTAETGQVFTFVGTAQLDTAYKKFGTASLLLDGDSDYVTLPTNATWNFGAEDFTIDCWVYPTNIVDGSDRRTIVSNQYYTQNVNGNWMLAIFPNGYIGFVAYDGITPLGSISSAAGAVVINSWQHIALVRNSNVIKIYVDGVEKASGAFTPTLGDTTPVIEIGDYYSDMIGRGGYFAGGIDEVRILKGTAVWTEPFNGTLQSYSESTIKTQGSYSLKGIAAITASLNKTLTRTVSPTINASDRTSIKFDIYASRTGSNIKIGIRDSGSTITEITPNILTANTWQTVNWDISAVSNANKDAIDRIIATIVNADAANTFYIDNMYAEVVAAAAGGWYAGE